MGALFQTQDEGGRRIEVRARGPQRRLLVDGVLHSQWNPEQCFTGDLWDLLGTTPSFAPAGAIQRVLVLGLGGGTALHLIKALYRPERIVGVDLDPIRIDLARRFFGINPKDYEIHQGDAQRFVENYRGPPFQLIIEDVCGERDGEPQRPIAMDRAWTGALLKVLDQPGWLAVNFLYPRELAGAALMRGHRRRFPSAFAVKTQESLNTVGVFCGTKTTPAAVRDALRAHPRIRAHEEALAPMAFRTLWGA